MQPFRPFTPVVLAFAQELQRLAQENPKLTLEEAVRSMLDERTPLHASEMRPVASQLNDLMHLAEPGPDDLRLAMMIFLPGRRGCLFTMQALPLTEVQQFQTSPIPQVGGRLASSLDQNWAEVLQAVQAIPPVHPLRLVGPNGLPPETHHPAAAGPQPSSARFLRP